MSRTIAPKTQNVSERYRYDLLINHNYGIVTYITISKHACDAYCMHKHVVSHTLNALSEHAWGTRIVHRTYWLRNAKCRDVPMKRKQNKKNLRQLQRCELRPESVEMAIMKMAVRTAEQSKKIRIL